MVRRTARACTNGITPITSKPAIKNPIPINTICSTMTPPEPDQPQFSPECHAGPHATSAGGVKLNQSKHFVNDAQSCGFAPAPDPRHRGRPCERYRSNDPSGSERVPGRRRREFEIADIGAETNSDPG